MTIELTYEDFFVKQFQETCEEELQWDASDNLDITYKFDAQISKGWRREIELREGLRFEIDRHQLIDHTVVSCPDAECHFVKCSFCLSGKGEKIIAGQYSLRTNGLLSQMVENYTNTEPFHVIEIFICPSVLCSFTVSPGKEFPKDLQHLVKTLNQELYIRYGDIQPQMMAVIQQLFRCPYQGMIKRVYLESKAIELTALVLDHETAIQQGETKKISLKPEQLEQVHYAKEILLHDLSNPPSLENLARQAGLNDFLLKQGFRQAFGTTVFGELRSHRLKMAKLLLAEQNVSVTEVAHQVGYASLPAFTTAFKRKFGLNPKEHQKACR
ncbi:MAG: AraC family transcriptional regulator [Cyanobacteria bacterium P01_H01_bin.153]